MADSKEDKLTDLLAIEEAQRELEFQVNKRNNQKKENHYEFNMTPKELYSYLSESVIGQQEAKQKLSTAVCYHYQNLSTNGHERRSSTHKNNVLLIGPTGCGKTYLVQKIAQVVNVPLLIADATRFSGTGYVGDNVDSLVHDLVLKSNGDFNVASKGIIYLDEIDKIAISSGQGRDVSGRDVQVGLLGIIEGGSEAKINFRGSERSIKTDDILFICGGAFSNLYSSLRGNHVVDPHKKSEFDDGEYLHNIEIPQLIESLKKYGMMPELLGRIPVLARLRSLNQDDLKRILIESSDSVIKKYQKDFASYGITANFLESAYDSIASKAYHRNMGARGLGAVVEESLTPLKFHLPGTGIDYVEITSETIDNSLENTLKVIENFKTKLGEVKQ